MKLSIASFALFAGVATAATLRSSPKSGVESSDLKASVTLGGVKGEPSADDLDLIGKAFVASYNDVHWEVDHSMLGSHATEAVGLGEFAIKTPVSWTCRLCPDDDAAASTTMIGAMSPELEVTFCNRIRSSGSNYLKSTKHCSLELTSHDEKTSKTEVAPAVAMVDATLVLKGIEGGATSAGDQAVIAKAYTAAYNQIHWNDGHYLSEPEVMSNDLQWTCRLCPDDDASNAMTTVLEIASPVVEWTCRLCPDDDAQKLGWTCRLCPDDDASDVATYTKNALENAILSKIRAKGGKFANVSSVSIARAQTLNAVANAF